MNPGPQVSAMVMVMVMLSSAVVNKLTIFLLSCLQPGTQALKGPRKLYTGKVRISNLASESLSPLSCAFAAVAIKRKKSRVDSDNKVLVNVKSSIS